MRNWYGPRVSQERSACALFAIMSPCQKSLPTGSPMTLEAEIRTDPSERAEGSHVIHDAEWQYAVANANILPDGTPRLNHQPPLQRAAMVSEPWQTNPFTGWWQRRVARQRQRRRDRRGPAHEGADWRLAGARRRWVLLVLVLAQAIAATAYMSSVLPYQGAALLELAILAVFGILFAWVSAGFWTALAGFWQLMRGVDQYSISARAPVADTIAEHARTALVMPICNEDVSRVFAGIRATLESLQRTGQAATFDCFILS